MVLPEALREGPSLPRPRPRGLVPLLRHSPSQRAGAQRRCERCQTPITRRDLAQWFLRITDYAEELLDFDGLLEWPEKILAMQRNWVGRSEGTEISFDISHYNLEQKEIRTFTTRIDTIFGVTFMVLAPEHPLVPLLTTPDQQEAVQAYIKEARAATEIERMSTEKEKTGVP